MQLLLWRGMATVLVLLVVAWFYLPSVGMEQRHLLAYVALLFVALSVIQSICFRCHWSVVRQLFLQFFSDIVLVACLVFITGGYQSPFILLFGLIIVAAGTQAEVLLVLSMAVLSGSAYLISIYSFAWWQHMPLPEDATLNLLLQISVLMLLGGVMAVIARRHARLHENSQREAVKHQRFQALHTRLMASMQEGVLVLDKQGMIRDSNPAAYVMLHIPVDSVLNIREIIGFPKDVIGFLQAPGEETAFRCEWTQGKTDYLLTIGIFPEPQAEAYCWLTLVDVSELRALQRRVSEHKKLVAMGRMTAMLAHELRNPMQTIAQAVDLVTRVDEENQANIQRVVSEEISRLNRLVEDMLDYTKPLTPKPKDIEMFDLLIASIEQVDSEQKYLIELICDIGILHMDENHMRLVLDNLLRNAVLASPMPRSVVVHVMGNGKAWQLTVTDHGGGIAEEVKGQLFEPFASHRSGGTGLGLATVWQVCQANKWKIDVQSKADKTVFSIRGKA